jgi:hypothetical protein
MHGGRLIRWRHSREPDLRCHVSLFDLDHSRAGRLGMTDPDPWTDNPPFHLINSNLSHGEIRMKHPPPVHVASRSFQLNRSCFPTQMVCDDEHMVFWAVCSAFVPCC